MRTLGIDLAAEPAGTAACTITWAAGGATAEVERGLNDDDLRDRITQADKVGIDCPFGWPADFVAAIVAHSRRERWPGRGRGGIKGRHPLRFRRTDDDVHERAGLWPLSVSSDRIGVTAMRCAGLLDALAADGCPVDRAGGGRVAEVYPAAALKCWGLRRPGYKQSPAILAGLLAVIRGAAPWLRLDADAADLCARSHDALDALVCALVARAVALGRTTGPKPEDAEAAAVEGWIHLPEGGLAELAP